MNGYSETLKYLPFLVDGLGWTVVMSIGAMAGATVVGLLCALGRDSRFGVVRSAVGVYGNVFRSTPLLIQLLWIYYALPVLTGYSFTAVQSGLIGMSLHSGAYLAEVFRAGIASVPRGQVDAAEALGMSRYSVATRVVLPQAVRNMLPALTNNLIIIVKDSSLLSFVSVSELLRNGQTVAAFMQKNMEPLTIVAVLYLLVTAPLAFLAHTLEARRKRAAS